MSRRPVSLWKLVGLMMVAAVLLALATGFTPPPGPPPQATEEPGQKPFNAEAILRGKEGNYGILPAGLPTATRRYKIGLSMITMAQDYTIDIVNGAKAMAAQLGVDFEVYDAAVDANKELADVETMVANKFDGIFVYATDPALGPVISKKMKDAGVVALGADTPMTAEDSYYGVPSIYGGYISGKYMMEQMKAKNWDPKETVYLFADLSAFPACTMRLEGYKKALDEFYPDFPKENIVWYDVPYSLEESLKSIQDSITAHPAKNYLYAVACGDQMAAGGARALEAAGYTSDNAMISGQGGGIGPREELKKPGSLYISYTGYLGTCAGKLAINFMVRLLNGEKDLPQNVQQKVVLLTKDTVDQYYPGGVELCTDEDARGLLPETEAPKEAQAFNAEAILRGKEGHYGILPAGLPTPSRSYKIGLSMITMAQDYTIDIVNGAKAMAQQLGVSFEVFDAAVDANKELADVETMIANKFDGIFVYATDPALGPVISKKMKDAGVVALGADTPMTAEDHYYGVPSIYGGYISGKYMMEQMKAKNWDPKETVYLFADLSAFPACTMRLEGYKKALDEFYPDFPKENIVWYDVPYSLEESLKSIQDSITAHPAKNYLYAVACGDQMAAGGARALEAAGYTSDNAMISGQGGGIGPREELKKPGSLYISYTGYLGTCAGKLAINFMVRLLNGEKDLPQNVQQKVVLLTKDTVDQYYPGGVELCTDEDARGLLP